jgi:hypothetical protein
MARYVIEISVSAVKMPDPVEPVEVEAFATKPGEDPIAAQARLVEHASKILQPKGGPIYCTTATGMKTNRAIVIRAESFAGLAELLGQFDALAEKIECNNPVAP